MIIAGEASGDMHGAHLVSAMHELAGDLYFYGVGDQGLRSAGVEIVVESRQVAVVGLIEVIAHLGQIRSAFRQLVQRLRAAPPALLILIDFPDFNLMLAKQAKKLGIPIFYYISPQVWAWRSGRVKKIARLVDRLAVILPFEKEFYAQKGYDIAEFVGHPLVDTVCASDRAKNFRSDHHIDAEATIVGLLPGSRKREIASILPDFIETARQLKRIKEKVCFVMPLAPTLNESDLPISELDRQEIDLRVITEARYDLMANCDLVMVASGTVTLELALLRVPMVVVYRIAPLTYRLGRALIKIKFASLVNLIAGREVVKELLQKDFTPENVLKALLEIWPGTSRHASLRVQLGEIREKVGPIGASERAAKLALKLIN